MFDEFVIDLYSIPFVGNVKLSKFQNKKRKNEETSKRMRNLTPDQRKDGHGK